MQWHEITISTVSSAIDLLGAKLTSIGYDSFIVDDSDDFQQFLTENTQYWDYVDEELAEKMKNISQIRLYIEADQHAPERLSVLRDELTAFRASADQEVGTLEISIENLQEEDWENSWKQYYQPIPVGKRLLIVPEWMNPENPEQRIELRLDPGMIFGTGAHASTQMCLCTLEETLKAGDTVIDLGSGSGILSIAALELGAASAIGIDIDPKAEDIARENAALNNLRAPAFRAITGNVIGDEDILESLKLEDGYQIVLANIVADVIIPLSRVVPALLNPNGHFICSGVLNTRLAEVTDAIRSAGMEILQVIERNDWCCISAVLRHAEVEQ